MSWNKPKWRDFLRILKWGWILDQFQAEESNMTVRPLQCIAVCWMKEFFLIIRYYLAVGKLEKQLDEMRQVCWDFTLSLKGLRRGEIWKDKWNCLMLIAHAWLPGQGDDGPEEGRSRCSQRQAWRSGIPMWKWFRNWIPKLMLRLLNRGQRLANWRQNWRFQDRSAEWRHLNHGHVEYNCGSLHDLPMQMQCLLGDEDASKCVSGVWWCCERQCGSKERNKRKDSTQQDSSQVQIR